MRIRSSLTILFALGVLETMPQSTGLHIFEMNGEASIADLEIGLDGSLYLAGSMDSTGVPHALIIHCTPEGSLIQVNAYTTPGDGMYCAAICQRPDSGFWVAGQSGAPNSGVFTLSLDAMLAPLSCSVRPPFSWARYVTFLTLTPGGAPVTGGFATATLGISSWHSETGVWGIGGDPGSYIKDGDSGPHGSAFLGHHDHGHALIRRSNVVGNLLYQTTFRVPPYRTHRIAIGPEGASVVGGETTGGNIAVVKIDSAGTVIWAQSITTADDDRVAAVRIRDDQRVLVLSYQYNVGIHLTQLSPTGDPEWTRSYEAPNVVLYGSDLAILPNGTGYAIVGTATVSGLAKPFLLTTDTAGLTYSCDGAPLSAVGQAVSLLPATWVNGPDVGGTYNMNVYDHDPTAVDVLVCGSISTATPERVEKADLRVLPNPLNTSARVLVGPRATGSAVLKLLGITGRLEREIPVPVNGEVVLDREHLASGLYLLILDEGGATVASTRLVIE